MAVDDTLAVTSRLSSIKAVENALDFVPENPLRDPFAGVWMYMTDHFTKFQIATFGSFIVHEVGITLLALMPAKHAQEIGTRNWYQLSGIRNLHLCLSIWYQFLARNRTQKLCGM